MEKDVLLAKNHFPTYCKYIYPKYVYADHLVEIMKALTDIEKGNLDRLILNLPPRCINDDEEVVAVVNGELGYYKHSDLNIGDKVFDENGDLV